MAAVHGARAASHTLPSVFGLHLHSPWRQWCSPQGVAKPRLLIRGTQLRCPRLAWAGPTTEEAGCPGAAVLMGVGGSWCLPYSKASNSPRLVRGEQGCPAGSPPPIHMPPRRKCAQIRDLATQPSSPLPWEGIFVSPWSLLEQPPKLAGTGLTLVKHFLQHCVTTQYCISSINTHF